MLAGSTERWSLFFTYPLRAASLLTLVDCLWQFCHQRVIAQDFQFQAYFRKTFCFVFCLFNTLLPGDDSVPMYSRAVRKMAVPWLVHYIICTFLSVDFGRDVEPSAAVGPVFDRLLGREKNDWVFQWRLRFSNQWREKQRDKAQTRDCRHSPNRTTRDEDQIRILFHSKGCFPCC